MATSTASRFRFRWQYSLRALLACMMIVGGALSIYRWPWQETVWVKAKIDEPNSYDRLWWLDEMPPREFTVETKTVTSYRRRWRDYPKLYRPQWGDMPVQDGPERMYYDDQLIREANYRDGQQHGVTRCYNYLGELTEETTYRDDARHGPHRIGDGKRWRSIGTFYQEQFDGDWLVLEDRKLPPSLCPSYWDGDSFVCGDGPRGADWVVDDYWQIRQQWSRGQRIGHWEWRSPSNELLQAADYDAAGQLTHWNSQPVVAPFWIWIERAIGDDADLRMVLRKKDHEFIVNYDHPNTMRWLQGTTEFWFELPNQTGSGRQCVVIHCDRLQHVDPIVERNQSIGLNLLETALLSGLTLDYRYGGLWLTPAHDVGDGFRDPTGVEKISFPPDSQEALAWEEPVKLYEKQSAGPVLWMQYLLAGTSLELDAGEISDHRHSRQIEPRELFCLRRRRDAIALILYRSGLQCVQQGSKICLQPHWSGSRSYEQLHPGHIGGAVFD